MVSTDSGESIKDVIFRLKLQADPGNRKASDDTITQANRVRAEAEKASTASRQAAQSEEQRLNQIAAAQMGSMRRQAEYRRQDAAQEQQEAAVRAATHRREQGELNDANRAREQATRAIEQQSQRIAVAQELAGRKAEAANRRIFTAVAGSSRGGMVMGITELARGYEFLGLSGGKANKELVETILRLQGLTDLVRGSMAVLGGMEKAWTAVKTAAEAAAAAQAAAGAVSRAGTMSGMAAAAGLTGASLSGGATIGATIATTGFLIQALIRLGETMDGTVHKTNSLTNRIGEGEAGFMTSLMEHFVDPKRRTPYGPGEAVERNTEQGTFDKLLGLRTSGVSLYGPYLDAARLGLQTKQMIAGRDDMLSAQQERDERLRPQFERAAAERARQFEAANAGPFGDKRTVAGISTQMAQIAQDLAKAERDRVEIERKDAMTINGAKAFNVAPSELLDPLTRQREDAERLLKLTGDLGQLKLKQDEQQLELAKTVLELYTRQAEKLREQLNAQHERTMTAKERLLDLDPFRRAQMAQSLRRVEAGGGTFADLKRVRPFHEMLREDADKRYETGINEQVGKLGLADVFRPAEQKELTIRQQLDVRVDLGRDMIRQVGLIDGATKADTALFQQKVAEAARQLWEKRKSEDQAKLEAQLRGRDAQLSPGP